MAKVSEKVRVDDIDYRSIGHVIDVLTELVASGKVPKDASFNIHTYENYGGPESDIELQWYREETSAEAKARRAKQKAEAEKLRAFYEKQLKRLKEGN